MYAPAKKAFAVSETHSNSSGIPDSESFPPDGGLTACLTVFGAFLIQVGGPGFSNTFSVFQDFYSQHYLTDVSPVTISWVGSTSSFLILSGGLLFGRLYDNGYFYWLTIGGCCLQSLCLFMLSLAQRNQFLQVFLCQGLGFGLAASMSYVPSFAVLPHYFQKRRAIVMSIVAAGSPIGAIGYTILLSKLLNGNLGFANSIRITAATNTLVSFIGCALMRTRSYPKTWTPYSQLLRSSSGDFPYIFASIGMFLFGAGGFFPIFYIQLDSSMHRLGNYFSFYIVVILNGGNFIGRVTAGFIAAYCGISNTVVTSTLSAGIITFAMMALSTRIGAASIGTFLGYFIGFSVALIAPLITELTHDLFEIGARLGITLFVTGVGNLIGTPVAGALLGSHYSWWKPAVFCGCLNIASAVMFAIAQLILQHKKRAMALTL